MIFGHASLLRLTFMTIINLQLGGMQQLAAVCPLVEVFSPSLLSVVTRLKVWLSYRYESITYKNELSIVIEY